MRHSLKEVIEWADSHADQEVDSEIRNCILEMALFLSAIKIALISQGNIKRKTGN